jgi:hypothetical protein
MSRTRTKVLPSIAMLIVSAALVGSLMATPAGAKAKPKPKVIDSIEATAPKTGAGKITRTGKTYEISLPLYVFNQVHHYVLKVKGNEVDSFDITVTPTQGAQLTATTTKGGQVSCMQDHKMPYGNGNSGCYGTLVPAK